MPGEDEQIARPLRAPRPPRRSLIPSLLDDPSGGAALALLRIATGLGILLVIWTERPWVYAGIDLPRRMNGAGIVDVFPTTAAAAAFGTAALVLASAAVVVGWRTRLTAWIAFVLGVWVLGLPQGIAGVNHYHHVLWMLVIVACGPADHRFSIRPTPAGDAGTPMAFARALVGCVYFFPGISKLLIADRWLGADHLQGHIADAQANRELWVELMPPDWLIPLLALGALVFELGFVVAVFTRWRPWAVLTAATFHLSVTLLMGIRFDTMLLLLPALAAPQPARPLAPTASRTVPAAALVAVVAAMGVAQLEVAWPVARYPGFDLAAPGSTDTRVVVVATTQDGRTMRPGDVLIPHAGVARRVKLERSQRPQDLEHAIAEHLGVLVEVSRREVPLNPGADESTPAR